MKAQNINTLKDVTIKKNVTFKLGSIIVYKDNSHKKLFYETTKDLHRFKIFLRFDNEKDLNMVLKTVFLASNSAKVKIQNIIRAKYSDSQIEQMTDKDRTLLFNFDTIFSKVKLNETLTKKEQGKKLAKTMNLKELEEMQKMIEEQKEILLAQ